MLIGLGIFVVIALVGLAAERFGVDSRDGNDWRCHRPLEASC